MTLREHSRAGATIIVRVSCIRDLCFNQLTGENESPGGFYLVNMSFFIFHEYPRACVYVCVCTENTYARDCGRIA